MNIIVTACQVPFIAGGANHQVNGLVTALQHAGHHVELLRFPFQFQPAASVLSLMTFCEQLDLSRPNGQRVDRLISLQFPGYGVTHPHHIVWVMHQFRAVYELFDSKTATPESLNMRETVIDYDNRVLARARRRFAESARVAERLSHFNGLDSDPLLHPPAFATHFRWAEPEPYVFYPSRVENLKRQSLLIEAARHLRSPVAILIAGTGGLTDHCRQLIIRYGLEHRVRLLGHVSEAEKIAFYAHALAVFFGPFDEDYGYITLEAMLSSKPVITCTDSGGPLEFVIEGETGRIVPPLPETIAEAIDALHGNPQTAIEMGRAGRDRYQRLDINWESTITRLLDA
ncbi:glycosyltransferase family 4 protein [Thiocystis violacea]|uniref:glycosyltransferase family 4 protein n=1 Tax=Thiocystis violacea TaxID=13725 RepID=UPI001907A311|nr:glycosyltransferase family 4 protein [Thiocystis violacea]MBK1723514.1 glycosyl transferase [Thiocystis violacea]